MRKLIKIFSLVIVVLAGLSAYAKAAPTHEDKKVILYPKFIITYAEDFIAFKNYMNESKEDYRSRRAGELISQSTGTIDQKNQFNSQTIYNNPAQGAASNVNTQTTSENTSTFANPEIMALMMKAYDKFDYSYERDRASSRRGIGQELSGQLQSKLFALKERNLISDEDSNIDFTYGKYSANEMNDRIGAASGDYVEGRRAEDIATVATHFLYGHWSYYANEGSSAKQIKVTIFIEEIGGSIKTFEAVGSEEGGAMDKIAKMVFAYLHSNRNYHDPVAIFSNLKVTRPNSVDDMKTYIESASYCASQGNGSRLPYAEEVLGMVGQPYGPNGQVFLSSTKTYAVADLQGGSIPLKLVPGSGAAAATSLQQVSPAERISYFCVASKKDKPKATEETYKELYTLFNKIGSTYGKVITTELCADMEGELGMEKIKNMVIQIATKDPSPRIKGVVKQCTIAYLKKRPELFKELTLVSRL